MNISQSRTPNDQMSDLVEYLFRIRDSGDFHLYDDSTSSSSSLTSTSSSVLAVMIDLSKFEIFTDKLSETRTFLQNFNVIRKKVKEV